MSLLVHLSDLHLRPEPSSARRALLDGLVTAVDREHAALRRPRALLAITGDVFDSATDDREKVVPAFLDLLARLVDALDGAATIVLPGNHDRRRAGMLGPHRAELFRALFDAVDPERVFVAGCRTPFLAEIVPASLHGLDAHVVAYDSSYLPRGLFSAGGTIRHEDLLQANARLPPDGKQLVVLVHHHLIPTPLTDISGIETRRRPALARWFLSRVLPTLVSYGDREELTMTALGAGTALSTLHSIGRAVTLLHGHKHFPTARLVRGVLDGSGDVLIASAGSGGTRERVHASRNPEAARLWPSFNVVELTVDRLKVEVISFSPKNKERTPIKRDLVRASRDGARWNAEPVSPRVRNGAARVALDEARFTLAPSRDGRHWDYTCTREVKLHEGMKLRRYVDFVHASPATKTILGATRRGSGGRRIELEIGATTTYDAERALGRTLRAGADAYGPGSAFEWVGFLCRYGATRAQVTLLREGVGELEPFGAVTDLSTGRERPASIDRSSEAWTLRVDGCPARTLLRIYWPLAFD
jgi:3',5'-cyclic AMP phosphodiesterase CpdA